MKYTVGFIGTGNMGSALARAAAKSIGGENIALYDSSAEKSTQLASELNASAIPLAALISECKYIFLGVKPQILPELMSEISPMLASRKEPFVLVTMAAGTSMQKITELSGKEYPTIRIMPNTPVSIGKGMVLYCANSLAGDLSEFLHIMKNAGQLDALPEHLIDAGCSISGCGPAWVYMFIEALADGGVMCGLPRDKALACACNTLIGAAELAKSSGKHCGELKDAVCSPGGTTIAGVQALEENAFRGTIIKAVDAAYKKSIEMNNTSK